MNFFLNICDQSGKSLCIVQRVFNWDRNMARGIICKFSVFIKTGADTVWKFLESKCTIQIFTKIIPKKNQKQANLFLWPVYINLISVPSSIRTSNWKRIHYMFDKNQVRCRRWSHPIQKPHCGLHPTLGKHI